MARSTAVIVNFTIPNTQLLNFLQQTARAGGQVNMVVNQVNQNLNRMGNSAQRIAAGIGGYHALYTLMTLGDRMLRTGVKNAAAMEQTIMRMKLIANVTDKDMHRLVNRAERVGALLPALTTEDVLENQERLGRLLGKNTALIDKYTESFSSAAANIHLFSKGRVSADAAGALLEEALAAFGGFGGKLDINKFLTAFQAGTMLTPGVDPQKLFHGMRSAIPALQALGMSPEQIVQLGVFRANRPTGGVRAAGRDVSQLVVESIGLLEKLRESPKKSAERIALAKEFGILRPDSSPAILNEKGDLDVRRLFASMEAQTKMMKDTMDPKAYAMKVAQLGQLGLGQMAQRMLLQGFSGTTVDELTKIQEEMARVANSLEQFVQNQRKTTTGAYETVTSTAESLVTRAMMTPNTVIGKTLFQLNKILEKVQQAQQDGGVGISNSILGVVLGGGLGIKAITMGLYTAGFAKLLVGAISTTAVTALSGLGTALMIAGTGGLIVAAIGAVVLGGIALYNTSPWFKSAVDLLVEVVSKIILGAFNTLLGLQGNIHVNPDGTITRQGAGLTYGGLKTFLDKHGVAGALNPLNFIPYLYGLYAENTPNKPLLQNPPVPFSRDTSQDPFMSLPPDASNAAPTPPSPNPYNFTGQPVTNPNAGAKKSISRRNLMDALQEHLNNNQQNDYNWSSHSTGLGPSYFPRR